MKRYEISVELNYEAKPSCAILAHLEPASLESTNNRQQVEQLQANYEDWEGFVRTPGLDEIGHRQWLSVKGAFLLSMTAIVGLERTVHDLDALHADALETLPGDVATYLFPSRYCPIDRPGQFAALQFDGLEGGVLIAAMAGWIKDNIAYDGAASTSATTALDTLATRTGVCRDFAHVLIAMARALSIPARMVAAFSVGVKPQDFHAVVQVWLDGAWHLVDPTGMGTAADLIIIGVGRDATDIAFITAFGEVAMVDQSVIVKELRDDSESGIAA